MSDPEAPCGRKRVLCIDEDVDSLRVRKIFLEAAGYDVDIAATARAGLKLLSKVSVDVVILDYVIPEMDGTVVVIEIRKCWPHLPIIVLSAYYPAELPPELLTLSNGFIRKGSPPRELLSMLKEATTPRHIYFW